MDMAYYSDEDYYMGCEDDSEESFDVGYDMDTWINNMNIYYYAYSSVCSDGSILAEIERAKKNGVSFGGENCNILSNGNGV